MRAEIAEGLRVADKGAIELEPTPPVCKAGSGVVRKRLIFVENLLKSFEIGGFEQLQNRLQSKRASNAVFPRHLKSLAAIFAPENRR